MSSVSGAEQQQPTEKADLVRAAAVTTLPSALAPAAMSTRRGGKKKIQQKQQTIPSSAAAAAVEGLDEDPPRPAIAHATPASPVVIMQQLASKAITPVVKTAAKAITTAVALAMPAIAEGDLPASGIAAAQLDSDQPGSPGPSTGTQQPAFAMTAQKLFADSHPDRQAELGDTQGPHDSPEQQEPASGSNIDEAIADQQEQPPAADGAAVGASKQLHLVVQGLCSSCTGWRGVLLLCALVLVPVLITVRSQVHALHAQQELVLAQAHALANLRQELQATSAQLPSLLQAAHATNSSLSNLSTEQVNLLHNLAEMSALTQRMQQELGHLSGTHQAGQHAWELLTSVAALNCSGGQSDSAACLATNHSVSSIHNASAALKSIIQQSLQHAAQQKHARDRDQALQQQLLQALPQTIERAVQEQLSAQAPLPDVALADCGARIVSFTPIDASILRQLGGAAAAAAGGGGGQLGRGWGPLSILQQLQASLLPRNEPTGPPADAAPDGVAASQGATADRSTSSNLKAGGWSQRDQQLLLHRVMLRPASSLQPVSCIPFVHGVHGSPAVVEVQLPQAAYIHSVAVHRDAPSVHALNESTNAGGQPGVLGQISVALLNSSSCGGQAWTCTRTPSAADADLSVSADGASAAPGVLSPVVASAVFTHDGGFSSGRAAVSVAGNGADGQARGAVLADRVLVMVAGTEGVSGPCIGRISVYGRPSDHAGFC